MNRIDRLPYGALATWPFSDVTAVSLAYKGGGGISRVNDWTSGVGARTDVNASTGWTVEINNGVPAHFALPLGDMTKVFGDPGLVLPASGGNRDRIQALGINNPRFAETDAGPFSWPGAAFKARILYYAPENLDDLLHSLRVADSAGADRGLALLRDAARPKWHLGFNPETDPPMPPTPSQLNALPHDLDMLEDPAAGPRAILLQDPNDPLIASNDWFFLAGTIFYRADSQGRRIPGYYHSGLAQDSWSFDGHAKDQASKGGSGSAGKTFSDEQLLHWLDATTLDRSQTPVVIIHMATEAKAQHDIDASVRGILARYRAAFGAIGTAPPRFLLIGSYMHRVGNRPPEESRPFIEQLDAIYESLASTEPDCAFFSLYRATNGVFFTTDLKGGPGAQQQARDWLDANGWSTITYGGTTYNLSSAADGGLDGVLTADGVHLAAPPAAAFYAKLIGDALTLAQCRGDFNADGVVNTLDVLAFLNAWTANDPRADFNADGAVNTLDVLAFLNAWNT
ncbi:MAG: hypothetical protein KIS87_10195, partial [Phycisphaeraceae bacterium]|nr:hypothetical protein [Phycisphaeraceae bacterium]